MSAAPACAKRDVPLKHHLTPNASLYPLKARRIEIGTLEAVALATAQTAMRLLFPFAAVFVLSAIIPVSMQVFILPPALLGAACMSAFFFIDGPFYARNFLRPCLHPEAKKSSSASPRAAVIPRGSVQNEGNRRAPKASIFSLPPVGIANQGGTDCWLAATMQLMMNSGLVRSRIFKSSFNVEAFRSFFAEQDAYMRGEGRLCASTQKLRTALAERNHNIQSSGRQEDPFEAFQTIMEQIPEFQIEIIQKTLCTDLMDEKEGTVISKIHRNSPEAEGDWGVVESNLSYLSLAITDDGDLRTMLRDYTLESLQGDNQVFRHDENGHRMLFPVKRKEIWIKKAPHVLAIQIKRSKDAGAKDRSVVQVPLILDLRLHQAPPQTYRFRGASLHRGENFASGHYTALIERRGCWYHCNDGAVEAVSPEYVKAVLATETRNRQQMRGPEWAQAQSLDPYMLWYEKV